jgi:hypothetical protein
LKFDLNLLRICDILLISVLAEEISVAYRIKSIDDERRIIDSIQSTINTISLRIRELLFLAKKSGFCRGALS